MIETIWRATDADGRCWLYGEKPDWSEHQFYSQDGRFLEYYGTEKPPPGECWEMTVTRKGEPSDQQAAIAELQEKVRKLKVESATQTDAISEREDRIDRLSHDLGLMTRERDELRDKLERPEMPECVRELLDAVCLEVPGLFARMIYYGQKIAAVRDHYAPPLKFEVGGVYISSDERSEWELLKIARNGTMLFWGTTSEAVMRTDESGVSNIGGIKIVKRVR